MGAIGRVVAERYLRAGASVALTDLDGESLARLRDELGAGDRVACAAADVCSEAEVEAAVAAAVDGIGGIDILYNSAAVRLANRDLPVAELDRGVWEQTLEVNLLGAACFAKQAMPHLLASSSGGVILNVSSMAGLAGDPEAHAYAASKGGLIALSKSIAACYGPRGLRCVAICPGLIDTPMQSGAGAEISARLLEGTALRRLGLPGEVAAVAEFLASDDASFVTATAIEVHGGLSK